MTKSTVRIIGGNFRGKKLPVPDMEGLRPTPDRVRETLFNWLMHDIRDAHCLDAFAGSGALGFEAFSRGAAHVTFLEKDPKAHQNLIKQAAAFQSPKLVIKHTDACGFLKQKHPPFNIIFLDPPFANNYIPACLDDLAKSDLLAPNGLIYLEAPHEVDVDPNYWQCVKLKKAGQIVFGLYKGTRTY
jgi:16S rRNA (guanine966-N2)-methyltransferase